MKVIFDDGRNPDRMITPHRLLLRQYLDYYLEEFGHLPRRVHIVVSPDNSVLQFDGKDATDEVAA